MPSGSRFAYAHRRRARRYRPNFADEAFVEFDWPGVGHRRLKLLEIGARGVGFGLDDARRPMPIGTRIDGVILQAGGARVAGSLRIAHITSEFAAGTICGAEFTPASSGDGRTLAVLLDRLEKTGRRSG